MDLRQPKNTESEREVLFQLKDQSSASKPERILTRQRYWSKNPILRVFQDLAEFLLGGFVEALLPLILIVGLIVIAVKWFKKRGS